MNEIMTAVSGSESNQIFKIAEGVQNAVENGSWAYLAVICLFLFIEFNKKTIAKKFPSVKKNAAQYSAGLGAVTGAALGSDPVNGAIGGFMVGNAASGLSSFLRLSSGNGILAILSMALKLASLASRSISGTSKEEKAKIKKEFDEAVIKTKGENASTKDLEEWFSKHL